MMTLTEFLIRIGQDPNERAAFEQDAVTYIESALISPAHKHLLRTGTDEMVMEEVAFEATSGAFSGDPTVTSVTTTSAKGPPDNLILRSVEVR